MLNINHVYLAGRLVQGPDVKNLTSGGIIVQGLVETIHRSRGAVDRVDKDVIRVIAFGRVAEAMADSVKRGDNVTVVGRIRHESWTAADGSGERRQALKVRVESFGVLEPWVRRSDDDSDYDESYSDGDVEEDDYEKVAYD